MTVPYVHSGYERIENDNYQTVDPRCVKAFLQIVRPRNAVDVCSPSGSGIVTELVNQGIQSFGIGDAFREDIFCDWIVSNPPYKRDVVDGIIYKQLNRLENGDVAGVAMLMRANFDFAKSRTPMFKNNLLYEGQIKMLFRPIWIEGKQKAQPIHNFVWHIWTKGIHPTKKVWYIEE